MELGRNLDRRGCQLDRLLELTAVASYRSLASHRFRLDVIIARLAGKLRRAAIEDERDRAVAFNKCHIRSRDQCTLAAFEGIRRHTFERALDYLETAQFNQTCASPGQQVCDCIGRPSFNLVLYCQVPLRSGRKIIGAALLKQSYFVCSEFSLEPAF